MPLKQIKFCLPALLIFSISGFTHAQSAQKIHTKAILVDTHNDVLTTTIDKGYVFDADLKGQTHSDLNRMREGGVNVQIFSIWCDGQKGNPFSWANREIDTLYAVAARNPDKMMLVKTPDELMKAVKEKKLAAMLGVEGGHMIENDLNKLDSLAKRGVKYMTLTWNNSTSWASSAKDEAHGTVPNAKSGLNDFGKQVVKRMNELGMMVDLSHVGEQTFWDAINTTTKPVIISHSCVWSLCPVPRNLKDEQIKAVAKNGGVIHLNFYSGFLDSGFEKRDSLFGVRHKAEKDSLLKQNPEPYFANQYLYTKYKNEVQAMRPPLSLLIDHLDYIVKLVGVDYVGMGSDFDGINSAPRELEDITNYPLITQALLQRGYSKKDVYKILGGNFLRVFKANTPE